MNQLTVMLNNGNVSTNGHQQQPQQGQQTQPSQSGNAQHHHQQQQQQQQFFTFVNANQPQQQHPNASMHQNIQQPQTTFTLDQNGLLQQQPQHQQQATTQLVTFQQQQQQSVNGPGTILFGGGSQAYTNHQPSMTAPGTQFQYIIGAQQQQQPTMQSPFGMLQPGNMMSTTPGMITMNPQSLQPQMQPSFITMAATPQLQFQPQMQSQQPQFQIIGANSTLSNGAIFNAQPQQPQQAQLITNPVTGQTQFILQAPQPQPSFVTINQPPPQPQQLFQLVLPNGQVIQTTGQASTPQAQFQTQATINMQPMQQQQQQTTPINTLLPSGNQLAINSGQATTFLTAPAQQSVNMQNSPILLTNAQATPTYQLNISNNNNNQNAVLTSCAQSIPTQSPILLTPNQVGSNLLMPAPTILASPTPAPVVVTPSSATTMMVLTQPSIASSSIPATRTTFTSPMMPASVFDQKFLKHQQMNEKASNKAKQSKKNGQTGSKVSVPEALVDSDPKTNAISPSLAELPLETSTKQNEFSTQTSSVQESDQSSDCEKVMMDRPERPLSVSSNCSLRIDEEDNDEEHGSTEETDSKPDDGSTTTENDADIVDKSKSGNEEHDDEQSKGSDDSDKTIPEKVTDKAAIDMTMKVEDKDGYQSSYGGSPCHFTDTEDEEEEDEEDDAATETDVQDVNANEIKLVTKNGLTKAAYKLIDTRILGSSEDDSATNASVESCKSSAPSSIHEELCNINYKSETEKTMSPSEPRTSAAPSPALSMTSSNGTMEPESTTQNSLISSTKGKLYSMV